MKKYNEYTPKEIGISKTTWNWFPCQLEPNGPIHYTNGHVMTTKPPVKNWPTEAPVGGCLYGHRFTAFEKPYDASPVFRAFRADDWPTFAVTDKTERDDDNPGYVTLRSDTHTETISRHYYALAVKLYGKDLEFRQNKPLTPVQVRRNGKTVALIMPICR